MYIFLFWRRQLLISPQKPKLYLCFVSMSSSLLFLGLGASNFLFAFIAELDIAREPCGWEVERYARKGDCACGGGQMIM